MEHSFTQINIISEGQESIDYLQFGYIQSLLRKIKIAHKDVEIQKIDEVLFKIFYSYSQLKNSYSSSLEKHNGTLSQLSLSLDSQAKEKEMILLHNQQRDDLMEKLKYFTESNLQLLQQNQTLYQTMSKYQQINKALNENVEILSQSLIKQKELYNLQLKQCISKYQQSQSPHQKTNKDISLILQQYNSLIVQNSSIKNDVAELKQEVKALSIQRSLGRILFYYLTSENKISNMKPNFKQSLQQRFPSLGSITEDAISEDMKHQLLGLDQFLQDGNKISISTKSQHHNPQ